MNAALKPLSTSSPVTFPPDPDRDSRALHQHHSTRNMEPESSDDEEEPKYCICRNVSYGTMIECDNKDCEFKWFHQSCIGATPEPRDTWYCGACTKKMGLEANTLDDSGLLMKKRNIDRKYPYSCTVMIDDGQICTKKFQRQTDLDRHYDSVSDTFLTLQFFCGHNANFVIAGPPESPQPQVCALRYSICSP